MEPDDTLLQVGAQVAGPAPSHPKAASELSEVRLPPRYQLGSQIGAGGMGRVFRARDTTLGRDVAIKLIELGSASPALKERFIREAYATARLEHPNIIKVFDADPVGGWLAMELVSGRSLDVVVERDRSLPSGRVRLIASQVLAALAAAHAAGVIHRDLKPSNILIDDADKVTLLDFGVARLVDHTVTGTGETLGTPAYMAPEQLRGAKVDARTDLYSLGATLYELVRGERVAMFSAPTASDLAAMRDACQAEHGLANVIERCLQEAPSARFSTAVEARTALVAPAARITAPPTAVAQPDTRVTRAGVRPIFWLGLVGVLGGALWFTRTHSSAPDTTMPVIDPIDPADPTEPPITTSKPPRVSSPSWFARNRSRCNPTEITIAMADPHEDGITNAFRAACYVLAGKLEPARATLVAIRDDGERERAVDFVFQIVHPIADAGDDASAGPGMELVADLLPGHYMALFHAGMARAIANDEARARAYLTHFLELYRQPDQWTEMAKRALAALDRPRSQRTVTHGQEGNIVY